MRKKTISVETLLENVNAMLKTSTCSRDIRLGMCSVLEDVLHSTNNYNGFMLLTSDEVPDGENPGIIRGETTDKNTFPDDSRRQYFLK